MASRKHYLGKARMLGDTRMDHPNSHKRQTKPFGLEIISSLSESDILETQNNSESETSHTPIPTSAKPHVHIHSGPETHQSKSLYFPSTVPHITETSRTMAGNQSVIRPRIDLRGSNPHHPKGYFDWAQSNLPGELQ